MRALTIPNDPNVMVSIHAYNPYNFTMNTGSGATSVFDSNMYAMLGCATGAKRNTPEAVGIINAKNFICDTFIPSWINASNEPNDETGYFITEGRGLKKKLDEIGVPNDLVFFPGAKLPHGYMDQMDHEPHAKEAFKRMMAFIQKYI